MLAKHLKQRSAVGASLFVGLLAASASGAEGAEAKLQYNRDVRPILSAACLACHGPDSASREADLRLDQRDAAIEMAAITPGDPDGSEMIRRILSDDESEVMPPPELKRPLTDEQKEILVRWVRQGAEYQPHWSLITPTRPVPPDVRHDAWVRNPIDRFVAAKLEEAGLEPMPEADRHALARRVSLDLTGLPPSPELVAQFVADQSPEAYEKLVDKLLASPKWGEHRGRYWLDAARYGDTHGIHIDNYREIWAYRDWVVKAFNRNLPFDEFTIENLAGDLLPDASLENKIASGFNRCNITTSEGGAIDEEYAVLYTRDRTETTSAVWLGLTTGCAVCHDHKFDPISQKEFYSLSAFFNNTTQPAMDGNVKDTPPVVAAPLEADRPRWDELAKLLPAAEEKVAQRQAAARPSFDAWLAEAKLADLQTWIPSAGLHFAAPLNDGGNEVSYTVDSHARAAPLAATTEWREGKTGPQAAYLNQGAVLEAPEAGNFENDQPYSCAAWIKLPANDASGAIVARMDDQHDYRGWDLWMEGRRVGGHIINHWPKNALKVVTKEQLPADQWVHVAIVYDGSKQAAGLKVYVNGQLKPVNVQADALTETIRTSVPLKIGQRHTQAPLSGVAIEDVRIYGRALEASEASSLANAAVFTSVIAAAPAERKPENVEALYGWWLNNLDDEYKKFADERNALSREKTDVLARGTIAHVMQERPEPAKAYVLNRGEYDQRQDEVAPGVPAALPPFPTDAPRNRLGFAQWLLRPEHPLTARVTVNRFWQQLFGAGLVRTAGDFGVSGELPSHPELLDWLAVEFRESDWDVKQFFKLLVTSATYRQSATVTPAALAADPENKLLSRGPRFRMDAEMVRDLALAASGLLSPKIGGPSVKPYQPPGVWEAVAMIGSNTRDYQQDKGESLYRRSIYTFWKRSAPPASMEVFNAPSRERCTVTRERTNTPLQALVTLNDPQLVEAACQLAQGAIQASPQFEKRTAHIAERLIARDLRPEEQEIVRQSVERLSAYYADHADDARALIDVGETQPDPSIAPAELAAWTMVTNQLMNLDEVLNK
jgi:cytochrome c553